MPHRRRLSWRRRDVVRTCLRCGTGWRVPAALARGPRASKWSRGISPPERLGFRGMDTNAATAMQLDMAKARGARADDRLSVDVAMTTCPSCGAAGVYSEAKAARR